MIINPYAFGGAPPVPFGGAVDTTNLVEWWPMDEASGTRVGVHAGLDLTDNNTVTGGNDGVAYSQFTAANSEFLSRADEAAFSLGDVDFGWCGWVYLDDKSVSRPIVIKGISVGSNADFEFVLWYFVGSDRFGFHVSNGSANSSAYANTFGSPSTGTWYFIACWHDATANTVNIQVNDGTVDSASHTTGSFDSTHPFEIGRAGASSGLHHDGRKRRCGFWKNGFASSGERTSLYNGGSGLDY